MKIKKKLSVILFLLLVILMSVSCIRTGEKDEETGTSRTESKAKRDKKKSKENKKKKDSSKEPVDDRVVSEIPHILLEENYESSFEPDPSFKHLYSINNVHLKLRENSKEFEALIKAFDKYNEEMDEVFENDLSELSTKPHPADEEEYVEEEYVYETPGVDTRTHIVRADKSIVSVINYKYADYGGGSPEYHRYSTNFDTATGKKLEFSDVVKDEERFFKLADDRAEEYYQYNDFVTPSEYVRENGNDFAWTVNAEGVSIYFDIYNEDGGLENPQIVTVYFDEAKDIFESKYTKPEDDYVIPLLGDMKLSLDIDGDGEREIVYTDKVLAEGEEVYDGVYSGLKICVGDKESEKIYGYDYKSYIIKKNGKYYMYLFVGEVDDITLLYRVDLSTLEKKEDEYKVVSLAYREVYMEQSDNSYKIHSTKETFTDANSFFGAMRYDTFGTNTTEIEWIIDDEAYPAPKGNRYEITNGPVLYTISDIDCIEVDSGGKTGKNTTLPKDSYILLLYTDNENYVDVRVIDEKYVEESKWSGPEDRYFNLKDYSLLDYDGSCYRIEIEHGESLWDIRVNGETLDKLFEGISYSS